MRGGGPDMLELQNFQKMKDLCAEILGTFVFRKHIVDPHPPPSPTFSGKIFAFRKIFLRGPWNGRGPKFWNTPPQPETGWHGPVYISIYSLSNSIQQYNIASLETQKSLDYINISDLIFHN